MKKYRQDSHAVAMLGWVLLSSLFMASYAYLKPELSGPLGPLEIVLGTGFLAMQVVSLGTYLVRALWVYVAVDPERGILVGKRGVIPWNELQRVDRKRPRFRRSSGPLRTPEWGKPEAPESAAIGGAIGLFVPSWRTSRRGEGCVESLYMGASLFLPVIEVWLPFGDRVTIRSRSRILVLRDLRDADEFLEQVFRACKARGIRGVFPLHGREEWKDPN